MGLAVDTARRSLDLPGETGEGLAAITGRMLLDAARPKTKDIRDPSADQIGDHDEAGVVNAIDKIAHLLGAGDRRFMPWRFRPG